MANIGIICEYNPFHNGHLYHINKIKEMFKDSTLILVMSGNFTQRGIPSILAKDEKTLIAKKYGVDLVVELPFIYATESADIFADAAVTILNELKTKPSGLLQGEYGKEYQVSDNTTENSITYKFKCSYTLNNNEYTKDLSVT